LWVSPREEDQQHLAGNCEIEIVLISHINGSHFWPVFEEENGRSLLPYKRWVAAAVICEDHD